MKELLVLAVILAAMLSNGCQAAGESPQIVELQDKVGNLESDDIKAARTGAAYVHTSQHDSSHAVEGWLVEHGVVCEGEHQDE